MNSESNDNQMPSLPQQGINLTSTVADIIRETLQGNNLFASEFEQQRRYDICQVCEYFYAPQAKCKKCGCFMKKKVEFNATKCPIGKW
jgi:hypothetical protein